MKKNENYLMGMCRPKCKSLERFAVSAKCMTLMYDDGTEDSWDYEWGQEASCKCFKCKFWHCQRLYDRIKSKREIALKNRGTT